MLINRKVLFTVLIFLVVILASYFTFGLRKDNGDSIEKTEEGGVSAQIVIPKNLIQCTAELVAQNCDKAKEETICGYDETINESGEKSNNILQFKSACQYCKFYWLTETNIGGKRIKGLGYETKPCDQGMYKKK